MMEKDQMVIGFSRPKGVWFPFFSWLIQWSEKTTYSHVYVRWDSSWIERDCIYEARGNGVHFVSTKIFSEHTEPVHEFLISGIDRKKVVQFCMDNAGVSYGKLQTLGEVGRRLLLLVGIPVKNMFADGRKSQVCSEMVGYLLQDVLKERMEELDEAGPRKIFDMVMFLPRSVRLK